MMEEKIDRLIEIVKFLVEVDQGLSRQYANSILKMLDELKEEEA